MNFVRSTFAASAVLAIACSIFPVPSGAQTADDQPNASNDRLITAKVRKAIMADKGLSTYAHNIKIITMNGQITLKGPVKSEEEKQRIVTDLADVIPAGNITNQLTVKP